MTNQIVQGYLDSTLQILIAGGGFTSAKVRLFTNATPLPASTVLADLTPPVMAGYAPVAVTAFAGPYTRGDGTPYLDAGSYLFTNTGTQNVTVTGAALVADVLAGPTAIIQTMAFAGAISVPATSGALTVPVQMELFTIPVNTPDPTL